MMMMMIINMNVCSVDDFCSYPRKGRDISLHTRVAVVT
jgi:hypothetical protein